jgi:hypothetical protein
MSSLGNGWIRATAQHGPGTDSKGRAVQLQQLKSGLWYTIPTTHESASGLFSFSIKDAGT